MDDPTRSDPDKYKVVFENERVRFSSTATSQGRRRAHTDIPTALCTHSPLLTAASFDEGGKSRDVTLAMGEVRWLDAQTHSGQNIGETATHVLFVELKEERASRADPLESTLGPN